MESRDLLKMTYLQVPSSPHPVGVNPVSAIDHSCNPLTAFITKSTLTKKVEKNQNSHQGEKQPNSTQGETTPNRNNK